MLPIDMHNRKIRIILKKFFTAKEKPKTRDHFNPCLLTSF